MASRIDELDNKIGIITNIQFYSLCDGPGIRTNVFLKGCVLNCRWCHNPEGVRRNPEVFPYHPNCIGCGDCIEKCPSGAITLPEPTKPSVDKGRCTYCLQCTDFCRYRALVVYGRYVTVGEVITEVEKDKPFYKNSGGGMTLSGGDPLAQPDFTLSLLQAAQAREINTCLDTSGYAPWETLEKMIDYIDFFLWDIKHMDSAAHKDWSGVGNELILDNLKKVAERKKKIRIRVPIITGINDTNENLLATAQFVQSLGESIQGVDLLPYHPWAGAKYRLFGIDYPFPAGEGYNEERLLELLGIFEPYAAEVTVGG
ncbi:MAG: glycyl-radical enzyme activating protein [Chloroflexota bacterium]|nr:glycyl-radical enzyme activating protein [Chloroflexota bacterium]